MYRQLETERLFIRPITIDDKSFILELLNTQGWLQFIGDRKVRDASDAEKYIQSILDKENFFYQVFELKEAKIPIGVISFLYRDTQQYPDFGFAMLPAFQNKGYAFEATKKYLEEIVRENIVNNIIALTLPDNTQSIKLLEKLAFGYAYKYKDQAEVLHVYSLTLHTH